MSRDNFYSLKGWLVLIFIFVGLICFSYFFLDKPLALFFHKSHPVLGDIAQFINHFTNPSPNVLLWPLFFYFVHFILEKRSLSQKFLLIAISINFANLLSVLLKALFGRFRPVMFLAEQAYGFQFFGSHNLEYSFPSGHTVTITAILLSLAWLYPHRFFYFLGASFLLAFARVVVNDHFLSDVMAGVFIGIVASRAIFLPMRRAGLFIPK